MLLLRNVRDSNVRRDFEYSADCGVLFGLLVGWSVWARGFRALFGGGGLFGDEAV